MSFTAGMTNFGQHFVAVLSDTAIAALHLVMCYCLLGVAIYSANICSTQIFAMKNVDIASWLFSITFGIKVAFPLLPGWLQDAYREATATGSVVLPAFITKLSIQKLARGFSGTESLIGLGQR